MWVDFRSERWWKMTFLNFSKIFNFFESESFSLPWIFSALRNSQSILSVWADVVWYRAHQTSSHFRFKLTDFSETSLLHQISILLREPILGQIFPARYITCRAPHLQVTWMIFEIKLLNMKNDNLIHVSGFPIRTMRRNYIFEIFINFLNFRVRIIFFAVDFLCTGE